MGCERGHPRACLHAGVMDTFEPGVPITLTGDEESQILPASLSRTLFFENTFHKNNVSRVNYYQNISVPVIQR